MSRPPFALDDPRPLDDASPGRTITYAIADIHGRLDLLDDLLGMIEADAACSRASAKIIFTGDYLDRGLNSHGVVERLMAGPRRPGDRFICLKGNHDDLFAKAVFGGHELPAWASELHRHTFISYGAAPSSEEALRRHATFLTALPLTHDDGRNLFVHAGIRPGVELDAQVEHDLLWIRDEFLNHEKPLPRRVVHGHTIIGDQPVVTANRVSIDTGAFRSGILTAAVIEGEDLRFLQAIGEPDRGAIVREILLSAAIHRRVISPRAQEALDDFLDGRISATELERRIAT